MTISEQLEAEVILKVLYAVCDCITRDTNLPIDSKYAFRAKEKCLCLDFSLDQVSTFYCIIQQIQNTYAELREIADEDQQKFADQLSTAP